MILENMLLENCIVIKDHAADKKDVLQLLSELALQHPAMKNFQAEEVYKALEAREKLGSTGFSKQIAIPHCALENLAEFVLGILIVKDGVDFASLDQKPTKIFVFIIAPASQKTQHLRILSMISNYLRDQDNINKLLLASTPQAIRTSFLRHTIDKEELPKQDAYQLVQVIVQDEDKYEESFEEILDVLTGVEDCNFFVVEADNASKYLYKMPLFSMFWHETPSNRNRVITAILRKSYVHDTVKQINQIIEQSQNRSGILFFVQDIYYLSGSLNI
ncbi:MAG TPA: PTS sugar transporter subunit IIA [Candidatus Cloacimonadota bacterium]|nr:PTS sugar transporter subunit IIA [Candidatus Cloacimonadota bacterium]